MNENLNLVDILKNCPEGTKLYSPAYGDVELIDVFLDEETHPIRIKIPSNSTDTFAGKIHNLTKDGRLFGEYNGECMLFPSKEQQDWSKFKVKKPKFDPKTLKPFDKVLVRDERDYMWRCAIFSHRNDGYVYPYFANSAWFKYCIPYNEETKHLVGTTEEAPEFYRYWED